MPPIEMKVEVFGQVCECVGYVDGKRLATYAVFTDVDGIKKAQERAQAWADAWGSCWGF